MIVSMQPTRTLKRATIWKVTVGFIALGLAAFGLTACATGGPQAIGGPPLAVANQQANTMVAAVCGSGCPTLPTVTNGYAPLAAFSPTSGSATVNFANRPLKICYAVGSLSVGKLTYQIGSPIGGSTLLFDDVGADATALQGCIFDPGNDSGPTSVVIAASGSGSWVVRIDQQE